MDVSSVNKRPDVLLLCVDDMNDWAGCLQGYPGVQTPHIDRLAASGTLFTNAHCPSPLCNPSRTAILTGLAPYNSGVYNNSHWWRPAYPGLVSLPARFKTAGYHVAGAGKIFHHTDGFNPPDQWDDYFLQVFDDPWDRGNLNYGSKLTAGSDALASSRKKIHGHPLNGITPFEHEFDWGTLDLPESEYGDSLAADWAISELKKDHAQPLFLACGLFRPHLPCYAPQKYFDKYPLSAIKLPDLMDSDLEELPTAGAALAAARRNCFHQVRDHNKWEEAVQAYLATITFADAQIGRIIDSLLATERGRNTVIVFFSDNGFHLGEKHHWHKSTLWERSTHVPLVMVAPGVGGNGQRIERPVSLQDIYPTLADLCSLSILENEQIDGRSLLPLLSDKDIMWQQGTLTTFGPGNHAVRTERWRYIQYSDGGRELYDRNDDPYEEVNLSGREEFNKVIADLQSLLPDSEAKPVPVKKDYLFDPQNYQWNTIN